MRISPAMSGLLMWHCTARSYQIPDYQFQPPSATEYGMDEYGTPKAPSHSGSDGGSEGTGSGGGGGGGGGSGGSGGSGAPSGDDSSGGGAGLARIMTILLALLMSCAFFLSVYTDSSSSLQPCSDGHLQCYMHLFGVNSTGLSFQMCIMQPCHTPGPPHMDTCRPWQRLRPST